MRCRALGAASILCVLSFLAAGCTSPAANEPPARAYMVDLVSDHAAANTALRSLDEYRSFAAERGSAAAETDLLAAARVIGPLADYYNQARAPAGHVQSASDSTEGLMLMALTDAKFLSQADGRDCEPYTDKTADAKRCAPNVPSNLTEMHGAMAGWIDALAAYISGAHACVALETSSGSAMCQELGSLATAVNAASAKFDRAATAAGMASRFGVTASQQLTQRLDAHLDSQRTDVVSGRVYLVLLVDGANGREWTQFSTPTYFELSQDNLPYRDATLTMSVSADPAKHPQFALRLVDIADDGSEVPRFMVPFTGASTVSMDLVWKSTALTIECGDCTGEATWEFPLAPEEAP